ncbi:hypothetical protein GGX14DRAFT_566503 [Mycena pura]|uniref:Uncharacterized protein n=1 Tax=Mycena pura TaxID=153505 RepID=A0AAD6VH06_9AGAR|nr:hypothetical protein GGX14DRAFT_566503 [Mycena pura]
MDDLVPSMEGTMPFFYIAALLGEPLCVARYFALLNGIAFTGLEAQPFLRLLHPSWVYHHRHHHICAAYGLDPRLYAGDLPLRLPVAAVHQVALPLPSILLVLGYPQNEWLQRVFETPEQALEEGRLYCRFARAGVAWFIECLRRSLRLDESTLWRFGAVIGLGESVFLSRVRQSQSSAGTLPQTTFYNYPTLDFVGAGLIRPGFDYLGIYRDGDTIGLMLMPFRTTDNFPTSAIGPADDLVHAMFRGHTHTIVWVHNNAEAADAIVSIHNTNVASLAPSPTVSRAGSVNPSSSSDEESTSLGDTVYIYG